MAGFWRLNIFFTKVKGHEVDSAMLYMSSLIKKIQDGVRLDSQLRLLFTIKNIVENGNNSLD